MGEFDFIVVGAGSAGCVLADRLSRDPGNRVLLVEAGGRDSDPMIRIPKGLTKLMTKPEYVWYFETKPSGPDNASDFWMRGKTLGGSSAINGMVYNRGSAADWDALEALGNPGWGWSTMVGAFKSIENNELGATPTRGVGGPVNISTDASRRDPLCDEFIDAAGALGMARVDDYNESDGERIGFAMANIRRGRRVSAAHAFLRPAEKRKNLVVATKALATEVLFDGDRAVGVRVRKDKQFTDHTASREVILSLGSVQTPRLLQLSGIGPADVLTAAGVPVRLDQPNVGAHLREHRCFVSQYRLKDNLGYNRLLNTKVRENTQGVKYLATRRGPLARPGFDVVGFFKTDPALERPDAQLLMGPYSVSRKPNENVVIEDEPGIQVIGFILRPDSEGSIHITSTKPNAPLHIETNYFATDHDRQVGTQLFRKMRDVFTQSPLSRRIAHETLPGPEVQDDQAILDSAIQHGWCGSHTVGTCAMGPEPDAVVDADLRVRGVRNLRVMDASVLPTMVAGNLNGPIMAMAWRLSDLILSGADHATTAEELR